MRFPKELLLPAKTPQVRLKSSVEALASGDSTHTLGVLAFHFDGHVCFYAVDEDIKFIHGLVDAFLLELCREKNTWLRPVGG